MHSLMASSSSMQRNDFWLCARDVGHFAFHGCRLLQLQSRAKVMLCIVDGCQFCMATRSDPVSTTYSTIMQRGAVWLEQAVWASDMCQFITKKHLSIAMGRPCMPCCSANLVMGAAGTRGKKFRTKIWWIQLKSVRFFFDLTKGFFCSFVESYALDLSYFMPC